MIERILRQTAESDSFRYIVERRHLLEAADEIEHLKGFVFVDHLSQLKQARIKSKLAKQARITA